MVGAAAKHRVLLPQRKFLSIARSYTSNTLRRQSSLTSDHVSSETHFSLSESSSHNSQHLREMTPLSILPLGSILRSLIINSVSSSKILLEPSLTIMSLLAHSKSSLLSPDRNRILGFLLKHTLYRQFCAGENASEVRRTIDSLKSIGYKGVMLCYAREIVLTEKETNSLDTCGDDKVAEACIRDEIVPWKKGTLETVKLTGPDDFVAVKFTGAGRQALYALSRQADPSPALKEAIESVCKLAAERGVRLLFDAEQAALQPGIDAWTLEYMRKYNGKNGGRAVIYGTYQAYLKAAPSVVAKHLAAAEKGGFTLGVKLVRGAYLDSDPRHLIQDTKADTDACYDGIAEALARRSYNQVLKPVNAESKFPSVDVALAGHNLTSVRKARTLRVAQMQAGEKPIELVYAQLQGMADEISCELVYAGKNALQEGSSEKVPSQVDIPKAYKYLVWGTTGECMKYLLRRAYENKDAVQRTREGRNAMASELWRRIKGVVGLA